MPKTDLDELTSEEKKISDEAWQDYLEGKTIPLSKLIEGEKDAINQRRKPENHR